MSIDSFQLAGGLACGMLAGLAAQFGRLCSFAAIEDAVVAGDLRRARAWALATAVAVAATQLLAVRGLVDLAGQPYDYKIIEFGGLVVGALLFGIGMSLVGTCGFGVLVRAGTGDLRAAVSGLVLGIAAFAATGGVLSAPRLWLSGVATVDAARLGGGDLTRLAEHWLGAPWTLLPAVAVPLVLVAFAVSSRRFLAKPRLVAGAVLVGLAVAGGWVVTAGLADGFAPTRPESLTFVAPLGRAVLLAMGQTLGASAFAVASVIGVPLGSFLIAWWRDELRWEAFDDQREMRRHLLGACLMGIGGVLARGCTIGQGLSAASTLAVTAPIAVAGMILGARLGLFYLIEGRAILSGVVGRLRGPGRPARSCLPSRAPKR